MHLPPSKLGTKVSVSQVETVVTGGLESISLDKDIIIKHYVEASPYKKRGRSASPESQNNKSQQISASHSSAITWNPSPSVLLSITLSIRDPSLGLSGKRVVHDLSPLLDHDLQGSSSTTKGVFKGRALGGSFRFADAGKLIPILMPAYYNFFVPSEPMDVCMKVSSKISRRVLLYSSQDLDASPFLTVNHETVSRLPPVLQKLARKFLPLCSKFVHNDHCNTV